MKNCLFITISHLNYLIHVALVPIGERKISFVLQPYDHGDLESIHSSNTTLAVQGETENPSDERKSNYQLYFLILKLVMPIRKFWIIFYFKAKRLAQGRAHLLRRGQGFSHTSSFKRRSIKLRKNARKSLREEDDDGYFNFLFVLFWKSAVPPRVGTSCQDKSTFVAIIKPWNIFSSVT